jgi:hypothetical protein
MVPHIHDVTDGSLVYVLGKDNGVERVDSLCYSLTIINRHIQLNECIDHLDLHK